MRISDWSSDVCSSDLIDMRSHLPLVLAAFALTAPYSAKAAPASHGTHHVDAALEAALKAPTRTPAYVARDRYRHPAETLGFFGIRPDMTVVEIWPGGGWYTERSEEHTSELQSLMRISYAVFCLKKKTSEDTHREA